MERKYICSVQTHFTRTRRCPWRCGCTETRTGTETSRTSFRMSWTCSWTPGCRSECTVEAELWALVSISCSPAGTIIITLTTLLTLPPQPRGRPRAGARPVLAQHGRRPRPAGARGAGAGPLLETLPVPPPPALRPTRCQVRYRYRWFFLSSVITKDNFRKKGRKFCVHLSCLAIEEELRGSHVSHDIITELIGMF